MDVNGDVQQTSALAASLALQAARNGDGVALVDSDPSGRQLDVQNQPAQSAIAVAQGARTTKQPRRAKQRKKADLDHDRGRFRHTIRLEPKMEPKLRTVAEILSIDVNAAIAVCVSVQHHRLIKTAAEIPDTQGMEHRAECRRRFPSSECEDDPHQQFHILMEFGGSR